MGLLTAREFIQAGLKTSLIDQNAIGQEASWAGGGILSPLYPWNQADAITHLIKNSANSYPKIVNDLQECTGIDSEFIRCGMLTLKIPNTETALDWCNRFNVSICEAPKSEITASINHLNIDIGNALWMPEVAQIRNPLFIKALRAELISLGLSLYEHCRVTQLVCADDKIHTIKTSRGNFTCNQTVLTAGAWLNQLISENWQDVRIEPIKGQMLLYKAKPDLIPTIILSEDRYLIPRKDGCILVGSTVERSQFNKSTSDNARRSLQSFAISLVPALAEYPLSAQWAGLRPHAQSGIPYISQHPTITNLFVNCGHFRNGIAAAPASAQLIADLALGRNPSIRATDYASDAPR